MKNSGANAFYSLVYLDDWKSNIASWENASVHFQPMMAEIRQWCRERGIAFILGCEGTHWAPSEGWNQMRANAIFNINGSGDYWLNTFADMVTDLQPDVVHVMDEPDSQGTPYSLTQFFNAYKQFCVQAIQRYRAIIPNLPIVVDGCPFYNMHAIAASPIQELNITYKYDYYYSPDGIMPDLTSEPWRTDEYAYWTATNQDQLANAKALLYNQWLNTCGLQDCLNNGLKVIFCGVGTDPTNPNALVFMQDLYDFCAQRNIGVVALQMMPYPTYTAGMLDGSNWTIGENYPTILNALGELWAMNMKG
jgi:hypothetical protein